MAVKLRLQRFGANKRPYYRVVATDSRNPRDGRFIEVVGTYHPIEKNDVLKIDEEKALKWLNNGAQPTDTVKSLLSKLGIIEKFTKQTK
ncbi:MAG TPA: 30S ribosomal protein S16 [Bacilli bacterium]|nr:MAG: 30S ribosomal protein S16 [Tenericutes bacterium ADurb.BinA124]HNZ50014.1 30S ribosomal protein S16 [Bacilli bacterium]HOH18126.1 30S ribosomal protein S16 [Bacilli bacterium]HPN60542.1 30S ribosomal protein S16 [Bacilli bacterium]HPX84374.1 30S ribosomal protein S16 [Bacilli bacterium]